MSSPVVFREKNGRIRLGERYSCEHCAKSFIRRKHLSRGLQRYCSTKCAQAARAVPSRVATDCAHCHRPLAVTRTRLSRAKSGLVFCNKECFNAGKRLFGTVPAVRPAHYGKGGRTTRPGKSARRLYGARCQDCGFDYEPLLVTHHVDGDRSNNEPSNWELLCPLHHSIRHMALRNGQWRYLSSALAPRDMLPHLRALVESRSGLPIPEAMCCDGCRRQANGVADGQDRCCPKRGSSSAGRAQPCQG